MATKTKHTKRTTRTPVPASTQAGAPEWLTLGNRLAVAVTLAAVSIVFWTNGNDVYATPKVAVVGLAGLALITLQAWAVGATGTVRIPRSRLVLLLAAAIAVMGLALLLNPERLLSFFGEYGRGAGFLTYFVAGLVFVVVLLDFDERSVRTLVWVGVGTATVVVLYGFLQVLGSAPFQVPDGDLVVSTLGQINFVAGFVGIVLPLFLWVVAEPSHPVPLRIAGLALLVLTLVVGVNTASFQAYVGMGVAGIAFCLVWARQRLSHPAFRVGLVGLLVLALGVAVVGHSRIDRELRDGLSERVLMWQAGRDMALDRPILGYGPHGYAAEFTTYRPAAHARQFGIQQIVDAPHDVPLSMLVTGGVVLALLYLAFVLLIGRSLLRGLRQQRGARTLLLGAVGAAWLGYQAQSVISIDVPTLVIWHLVVAACVVVLSTESEVRAFRVPALTTVSRRGRLEVTTTGRVLQGLAVVVGAVGIWAVLRPVVADAAFLRARDARVSGEPAIAADELRRATGLAPWVPQYWAARAAAYAENGDQVNALAAGTRAADKAPSAVTYALSAAQLAQRMGQLDVADRYFTLAIRRSPFTPEVHRARADFLLAQGKTAQAVPLLRRAIALKANDIGDRLTLAEVYAHLGDRPLAKATYREVLRFDPTNPDARNALASGS